MKTRFQRIDEGEFDRAYAVYSEIFEWLKAKDVRQWLRPLSRDQFLERQHKGELFALYSDDVLSAVVTLVHETNAYWPEKVGEGRHWWIKSLGVARKFHHVGIGSLTMERCEAHLMAAGVVEAHLDCVEGGFLPAYYARLGYEKLARKNITYPSGNTFPMVLMRKKLTG